uniref:Uncharacterized protein n=1 Tax=Rhizophora mucronata TaxID=61149 RepID=A0A2P2Q716_RHIMU
MISHIEVKMEKFWMIVILLACFCILHLKSIGAQAIKHPFFFK